MKKKGKKTSSLPSVNCTQRNEQQEIYMRKKSLVEIINMATCRTLNEQTNEACTSLFILLHPR